MTMKTALLISLLVIFGCKTVREKPAPSEIAGVYHRVKSGDKLAELAKKYRVSVQEIMETNGIDDEKHLRVGQLLFMPDSDPIGKKITYLQEEKPAQKRKAHTQKSLSNENNRIFDFPVPGGEIIYRFSKAKDRPYDGIGIKAPRGSKIISAGDGRVLFVGDDGTKFGLLVIVEHASPYVSVYAHLDRAHVKTGQRVNRGQLLGLVGTSGGIKTPHLHFQIREEKRAQNPELFLRNY